MPDAFALGFDDPTAELQIDRLPVAGDLPPWLRGTLLRNGPGALRVGEQRYRHWFDGLAMLHRFSFADGRVSYGNRFLESRAYSKAQESGKIAYSEFATDPCRSLFGRVAAVFSPEVTDSAKVNVARLADRFLALAETPIQVEFDPETLRSVGVYTYEPQAFGSITTVHPQLDRAQELAYNLVTRHNAIAQYRIYEVGASGEPRRVGAVPVREPAYMHSFGMSRNHFVLADFPLKVNSLALLLWLKPYIENFHWKPRLGTPFIVLDRRSGAQVARFEADPFFAFHHLNTFERDGELIVDIAAYEDASIIQSFYLQRLADPAAALPWGQLRRYRLPLNKTRGRVTYELLGELCAELPRFDEERYAADGSYRFVYAMSVRADQPRGFYNQLAKFDLRGGPTLVWHERDCFPGEPVFVGAPGRGAEDDGVVLSLVLDAARGLSFLLVLDAQSFAERARAELPHAVLHGYHGNFFA